VAQYALGDNNFQPSNSAAVKLTVQPAVTLTSSLIQANVNQNVTLTATVAVGATAPATPSGTITFLDGTTTLSPAPVSNGTATFATAKLPVGSHLLTARYSGDGTFPASTSAVLTQIVRNGAFFAVAGAPGHVQVLKISDGSQVFDFTPFGTADTGLTGISVAWGDINGDGVEDLVVGAGSGSPHVKVYDGKAIANNTFNTTNPDASLLTSFFAYGTTFGVGVNVAVADVNGDGFADLITGASTGNPHVKVYDGNAIANGTFNGNPEGHL